MKKILKIVDAVLLTAIVLSVAQIIVDDIGVMNAWDTNFQDSMIVSGFVFDLLFSIEFIIRTIAALQKKEFKKYFFYQNGWIDFLASLPLLLLNSGPQLVLLVFTHTETGMRSIANLLKIIRAIRVTRILRVLRLLKIFGHIENAFSTMVQHHVSVISSMIVISGIVTYALLHVFGVIAHEDNLILEAKFSLMLTSVLIVEVGIIAFFYSAHFAKNVGDPLYVMKRGYEEENYNFSVKLNEHYSDHEVFQTAKSYNKLWLPLKTKILAAVKSKTKPKTESRDDYSDLL